MPRNRPDLISTYITSGVVFEAYGPVPASVREEAEETMSHLSEIAPGEVRSTRVKLKHDQDRSPDQVVIAQGSIDVSGVLFRVETAGESPDAALQAVGERLERKLNRLLHTDDAERGPSARASPADPAEDWIRPNFHYRPPERRTVVRRKTFSPLDRLSVEEALFYLDALDYRFFVFTDDEDDVVSIVYEDVDGPSLRKIDGSPGVEGSVPANVHVNEAEAARMTLADAVSRLNITDMPFVLFRDRDRGRPSVLYRRYDGHYGLLVPSTRIV